MSTAQTNPLFTRSEKGRFGRTMKKRVRGAARKAASKIFGIPLSKGLGQPSSRRKAHRSAPLHGASKTSSGPYQSTAVRSDVISALRGQGYNAGTAKKMAEGVRPDDSFESAFRRVISRNPAELIIFGNPEKVYGRKTLLAMKRASNPIPAALLSAFESAAGSKLFDEVTSGKRKNSHHGGTEARRNTEAKEGWFVTVNDGFYHAGPFDSKVKAQKIAKRLRGQDHYSMPGAHQNHPKVEFRRAANPPKRNTSNIASDYLNEVVNYGGRPATRAEIIRDLKSKGGSQAMIDRYLQGLDLGMRIRSKKKNPADRATQLFEKFHHREAAGEFERQRSERLRKDYAILGPLIAIGLNPEKFDAIAQRAIRNTGRKKWDDWAVNNFDKLPHLAFLTPGQVSQVKGILGDPDKYIKDCPLLASSPNGRQLYALAEDVQIDLSKFETDAGKDFVDLGDATFVVYIAKKPADVREWVHMLGEHGGTRPRLMYDRLRKEICFIGGSYVVKAPGIMH